MPALPPHGAAREPHPEPSAASHPEPERCLDGEGCQCVSEARHAGLGGCRATRMRAAWRAARPDTLGGKR